jgi:PncC family amidohydrolase
MESCPEDLHKLAKMVITQCKMKEFSLAVAESPTGGYLCHQLTNVDGCSKVFIGGFVSYSANMKNYTLKVDFDTINECGVISPETTEAMLDGIKHVIDADIGIAISGVAGSKMLEGKPRGLVYIGIFIGNMCREVRKFQFNGTRLEIKHATVKATFEFLLEFLDKV